MATSKIPPNPPDLTSRLPLSVVSDLNSPPSNSVSFVPTNANTLNTPYKAGLITYQVGFAFSYLSSANSGIQLYFVSGNADNMYIRAKAGGSWGNWRSIASAP